MNARLWIRKIDPVPAILVLIALFLSLFQIEKSGNLNAYYTAAVTSMTQSFHNFFYNSFDPGGFITIDKPPVAFWLQTISVKIFGLHSWSLALPSALAFAGSMVLLYFIVRSSFGIAAARLSAVIFTLTPIAVAVSRTNNVDSVLVFFLLLATYILKKAVQNQRLSTLCWAFVLVGVGFNTKMLQAYLILPAFYLFIWLAYKIDWKQKLKHLSAGTAVLIVVSLSWAVIVDLTPADKRPYIGSSQHNSVLELALGYNGIGRLTGDLSGSLAASQQVAAKIKAQDAHLTSTLPLDRDRSKINFSSSTSSQLESASEPSTLYSSSSAGAMSSTSEDGPPSLVRLLDVKLAGQITWLLPLGLFGIFLLWSRRREQRNEVLFWAAWLIPMIIVFSLAGYFHRYYLIMLAPAIAALAGSALAELYQSRSWKWTLPASLLGLGTITYIAYDDGYLALGLICFILGMLALLGLKLKGCRAARMALTLSLATLLALPAYWSLTPSLYGVSARQPYASPHLADDGGSWSQDGKPLDTELVKYMIENRGQAKYLAAMPSSNSGADALIIQTKLPVLAWGGFKGVDPALDVAGLQKLVRSGELRYVLIGGTHNKKDPIIRWVENNGVAIPESAWNPFYSNTAPVQNVSSADSDRLNIKGAIGQVFDNLGLDKSYTLYDLSSLRDIPL
ncbi:glycosyltransferase family 39 protein [Saccharibacillus sp. JS10]|uniref:ArnT family glycosyltransferase n=1 Tax=Saccharibacillus sp. JS10 TaxID=2950552 RepID=UPI00210DD343|nr:glycosyltransferase family 39 protein [Saccharibacillus sp. JS10]MCQ4088696.1 glycosyltransferase family 39 protein [Saccharibacillus sp. JS10]